ncbi:hypothetical protein [Streptomyces sp. NPDC050388]|uniref:hypothetical protein n=1 Tax=Streptomyces sp. NPDC050388 TaxID=3155781 RepID=UPI0034371E0F
MDLYFAVFYGLAALLVSASGVAAVTRGWVLPRYRPRVRRVRLFGWGQLVIGFAYCWLVVFGRLAIDNPGVRAWVTLSGIALLLAGVILVLASQRAGRKRQGGGMP